MVLKLTLLLSFQTLLLWSWSDPQWRQPEVGQSVLFPNSSGELSYGSLVSQKQRGSHIMGIISKLEHNGAGWTSNTYSIPVENLIRSIKSTEITRNGRRFEILRGTYITTASRQVYLVEDVFPDGRLIAHRVRFNLSSRSRLSSGFERIRLENEYLLNTSDITGVEVQCFARYCRGQSLTEIENVPICNRALMAEYRLSEHQSPLKDLNCNRSNNVSLNAVFSNGDMLLSQEKTINPFPPQLQNYLLTPRAEESISSSP